MKKVLFALPALAFTLFLAFCQKSNVQEEVIPVNTGTGASDRGTCVIEIFADNLNTLRICGIPGGGGALCTLCPGGTASAGINVISGYGIFTVTSPMVFSITNVGTTNTYVRVAPGGALTGGTGWVLLQANGGCATFTVNDDCSVN